MPNSPTKANVPLIQEHLIPCLTAQKKAVLRALTNPPVPSTSEGSAKGKGKAKAIEADGDFDNATAYGQLKDLLEGTTVRNEGNSCLLLGPKGSGKTRVSVLQTSLWATPHVSFPSSSNGASLKLLSPTRTRSLSSFDYLDGSSLTIVSP